MEKSIFLFLTCKKIKTYSFFENMQITANHNY